MSMLYEGALQDLVDEFGKLPGIGPKSAQRLAFHILQSPSEDVSGLARALTEVKKRVMKGEAYELGPTGGRA